jgi:peptide/nickel transport system permease protein
MRTIFSLSGSQKIRKRFWKFRSARWATYFMGLLFFLAFFADILATDLPLFVNYKGNYWFPAFTAVWNPERTEVITDPLTESKESIQFDIANWKEMSFESVIWAPIPWSENNPDLLNRDYCNPFDEQKLKKNDGTIVSSPFFFRHHFGTDQRGLDLLSGIIHGCSISLKIGFLSMLIATIIGVLAGAFSGYFGNDRLISTRGRWWLSILGLILGCFWAFSSRIYAIRDAINSGFWISTFNIILSMLIILGTVIGAAQLGRVLNRFGVFSKKITVPIDSIIQRFTEIFNSLPRLLIIVTLAAVFHDKSIGMVIAIIGFTNWTGISRFTRAEMFRTRDLNYIEAARSMGLPWYQVIFKHALPNAFAPVFIEIAFLVAGSIVAESSLSFLGIGVPDDAVTWGSILSAGRQQVDAWWMVVFPGLAIFLTVLSLNVIGERLREAGEKQA